LEDNSFTFHSGTSAAWKGCCSRYIL